MQESMVKLVLVLTALASLLIGGIFLVIPSWVVTVSGAASIEIGWLRSIGAFTVGLHGFGLLIASFRRRDTNPLLGIIAFVTILQAAVLWYSLFAAEFGEMDRWAIVVPAVAATIGDVLLWLSWGSRRASVGTLSEKTHKRQAVASRADEAGDPETAPPELVEEIDANSPRLEKPGNPGSE